MYECYALLEVISSVFCCGKSCKDIDNENQKHYPHYYYYI